MKQLTLNTQLFHPKEADRATQGVILAFSMMVSTSSAIAL